MAYQTNITKDNINGVIRGWATSSEYDEDIVYTYIDLYLKFYFEDNTLKMETSGVFTMFSPSLEMAEFTYGDIEPRQMFDVKYNVSDFKLELNNSIKIGDEIDVVKFDVDLDEGIIEIKFA